VSQPSDPKVAFLRREVISRVLLVLILVPALGCGISGTQRDKSRAGENSAQGVVPDLVGDTMNTVYDQLTEVGLVASAKNIFGDSGGTWGDQHVVVSTAPDAGTKLDVGGTVKVIEASKEQIVFYSKPLPDVRGTNWIEMGSGPIAAIYIYATTSWRTPRGKERPGTIVEQSPPPGTMLKLGERIALTVADYKAGDGGGSGNGGGIEIDVDMPSICRHTRWC
jgi:hypothetical protein